MRNKHQTVQPADDLVSTRQVQFSSAHPTQCVCLLFSLNLTRTVVMIAALNVNERGKPCSLVLEQRAPSG